MEVEGKKKPKFPRRNRIDTMACILKNSNDRSTRTRLIHTCDLSSAEFDRFRESLVRASLLVSIVDDEGETCGTTEKGKEFLADYRGIRSLSK